MYLSRAKCLFVLLFLYPGISALAQTTATSGSNSSNPTNGHENDPYSKYGIGEMVNANNVMLKGMGSATSAYENPYYINSDNPASYASLQLTTFEMGLTASSRVITGNLNGVSTSYTTGTGSISYMQLGIPLSRKNNAGMCLGFKPISHVYYNLVDSSFNTPIGTVFNSNNGEGSLNYAYIGGAGRIKKLSFGANVGYMFGTIRKTTAVVPIDSAITNRAYIAQYTNFTRIGGIYWKAGAIYKTKIDSQLTLRIGGTLSIQQKITEHFDAFQISSYNFGDTNANDTTGRLVNAKGNLTMPTTFSIGVMLSKNDKWNLSVDYTSTMWSGFKSTPDTGMVYGIGNSSSRFSIGGELTPNINDIRTYSARMTYRFGLYFGSQNLNLNNTTLPVYGFTGGLSFPIKKSTSHLNTSIDIGRLGQTTNNLLQETYVRFSLGMTFNHIWFIQRKYD